MADTRKATGKAIQDAMSGMFTASAQTGAAQPPTAPTIGTIVRWPGVEGHVCAFEVEHRSNGEPLVYACGCGRSILNMVADLRAQLIEANTKLALMEARSCP